MGTEPSDVGSMRITRYPYADGAMDRHFTAGLGRKVIGKIMMKADQGDFKQH